MRRQNLFPFAEEQVILQRINRKRFPAPTAIMHNLRQLTARVQFRLCESNESRERMIRGLLAGL